MNRISPLLQKLSELYLSKVRTQHLQDGMIQTGDIDSIMRHTRSAYSELLEWQRTMSEIESVMLQEGNGSTVPNTFQSLPQQSAPIPAATPRAPKPAPAPLPKPEPAARRAAAPPMPAPEPEPFVEEEEETQVGDNLYDDDVNPSGYAAMPEYVEEQPEEEEYVAPAPPPPPVRMAPRPTPVAQPAPPPVAAATQQVDTEPPMPRPRAATAPAAGSVSDIRELVTVNDKYLFVSELFNHNRTAYEKAMEAINKFRSRIQATNWVNALVKKEYKWEDDSPTAKAFYKVINQYFAAR